MKNALDSRIVLDVFEKVRQHGKRIEDDKIGSVYHLDGISVYTDFDGYTLYIKDALVLLQFGFHQQYHLTYEKNEHYSSFEQKVRAIHNNNYE